MQLREEISVRVKSEPLDLNAVSLLEATEITAYNFSEIEGQQHFMDELLSQDTKVSYF